MLLYFRRRQCKGSKMAGATWYSHESERRGHLVQASLGPVPWAYGKVGQGSGGMPGCLLSGARCNSKPLPSGLDDESSSSCCSFCPLLPQGLCICCSFCLKAQRPPPIPKSYEFIFQVSNPSSLPCCLYSVIRRNCWCFMESKLCTNLKVTFQKKNKNHECEIRSPHDEGPSRVLERAQANEGLALASLTLWWSWALWLQGMLCMGLHDLHSSFNPMLSHVNII